MAEAERIVRDARLAGWEVVDTTDGYLLRHSSGRTACVHKTPSDRNAAKSIRRIIRLIESEAALGIESARVAEAAETTVQAPQTRSQRKAERRAKRDALAAREAEIVAKTKAPERTEPVYGGAVRTPRPKRATEDQEISTYVLACDEHKAMLKQRCQESDAEMCHEGEDGEIFKVGYYSARLFVVEYKISQRSSLLAGYTQSPDCSWLLTCSDVKQAKEYEMEVIRKVQRGDKLVGKEQNRYRTSVIMDTSPAMSAFNKQVNLNMPVGQFQGFRQ